MRTTLPLALVAVLGAAASAHAARPWTPDKPVAGRDAKDVGKPMLTAREVMRDVTAYIPEIRTCYLAASARAKTATGQVMVELVIRPTGVVALVHATTPGLAGDAVERCLRRRSAAWRFAEAPGHTTAQIPFLFLKTHAPGAGPTGP